MKPLGRQVIAEFIYCSQRFLNDREALEETLREGIRESGLTLVGITGKQFFPVGLTSIAVISESHVAIHTYPEAGHASIDIFTCANGSKNVKKLLRFLRNRLKPKNVRVMEVHRGNPLSLDQENWITTFSGTGFDIRYHIDKVLYSKKTEFQQLDIIENHNFGRMMFLDKDLQIAESDAHIYDASLVTPLVKRKQGLGRVAILGGGDGGVLREVLSYNPESAHLIEIDGEVIKAAKKYLKGVCNNAFDNKKTNIILDDANRFLDDENGALPAGRPAFRQGRFDTIIYDLTMHPEAITNMDRTEFLRQIFSKIRKNLSQGGVVSMQCCSEFDSETRNLLKKILPRYFKKVTYQSVFIPSFCENWVFASAEKR